MKKILFMFVITLFIFIIYFNNSDRKIYYLSLTNKTNSNYNYYLIKDLKSKNLLEKAVLSFNKDNYRITDFINMINKNEEVYINKKKQNIKNALIKTDVLLLEVGYEDLLNIKSSKDLDELILYTDEYFNLIRKYCKENIIVLPIYLDNVNEEMLINYNKKLSDISLKYNMCFIKSDQKNLLNELKKKVKNIWFD